MAAEQRHNLPVDLTSFVGREEESLEVEGLLKRVRLLTLMGAGGVGKTRLARHVAARLVDYFGQGAWMVDLSPLSAGSRVDAAVTAALGLDQFPSMSDRDSLVEQLRSHDLLLVLDNCEHLTTKCADLAVALLSAAPRLRILVTSRHALEAAGETTWRVPSLPTPPKPVPAEAPRPLISYPAVTLFVERALAVHPDYVLMSDDLRAIAEIGRQLDGIPLAIELAAARIVSLSVQQIAARLDDRFALLRRGPSTAPTRHQTLEAAIDWSHALLSEPERVALRRLAVFADGWTIDAAEAVADGGRPVQAAASERTVSGTLDLLTSLVQKSMVTFRHGNDDGRGPRYAMLETVRQYAMRRLEASGEADAIRARYRAHFVATAEGSLLVTRGAERAQWTARLESEQENFRAVFEAASTRSEHTLDGIRLAVALQSFWYSMGQFAEGRRRLEWAAPLSAGAPEPLHRLALKGAGWMAMVQDDWPAAIPLLESSAEQCRRANDQFELVRVLHLLALIARFRGRFDDASALAREAREIASEDGVTAGVNVPFGEWLLGVIALDAGNLNDAVPWLERSLASARAIDDLPSIARGLDELGRAAALQGELDSARALHLEGLASARQVRFAQRVAYGLLHLGRVERLAGDAERAGQLLAESLELWRELGDRRDVAMTLEAIADLATDQDDATSGARLLGAAAVIRAQIEAPLPPSDRPAYARVERAISRALSLRARISAWQAGGALSLPAAISDGIEVAAAASSERPPFAAPALNSIRLPTARECEVAVLISRGLTNRQIAERLMISRRTVDRHVDNLLNRLGVPGRAAIAAWAVAQGLGDVSA